MMKIFVWSDGDLDGVGSLLALKWLYEREGMIVDSQHTHNGVGLITTLADWLDNHYAEYDRIFICDLSLDEDEIRVVDREKVVVIDHHKSHEDIKHLYTKAKAIVEEAPSTTSMIREKFKLDRKLDGAEKAFLDRVNDYDSYQLIYPESIKLNILLKKQKWDLFVKNFENGLRAFTAEEQQVIGVFFKSLKHQLDTTDYFRGTIKGYDCVACYFERYSSEMAHIVLNRSGADVCFCINLRYASVSLRKKRGCPIKLNVIAENFCNGGGHEYSAAGKLTDKFAALTKDFKNVQI